jgi:hypothetical protein
MLVLTRPDAETALVSHMHIHVEESEAVEAKADRKEKAAKKLPHHTFYGIKEIGTGGKS